MKTGILGTEMVGNPTTTKLVSEGHQVCMGSRTANSDAGQEWLRGMGGKAKIGTFKSFHSSQDRKGNTVRNVAIIETKTARFHRVVVATPQRIHNQSEIRK